MVVRIKYISAGSTLRTVPGTDSVPYILMVVAMVVVDEEEEEEEKRREEGKEELQ